MDTPLMKLSCIGAEAELHPGYVYIRPRGWIAELLGETGRKIPIRDIRDVYCFTGRAVVNNLLRITPHQGTTVYLVFSHRQREQGMQFYKSLDDLVTRHDILDVIRSMEH